MLSGTGHFTRNQNRKAAQTPLPDRVGLSKLHLRGPRDIVNLASLHQRRPQLTILKVNLTE